MSVCDVNSIGFAYEGEGVVAVNSIVFCFWNVGSYPYIVQNNLNDSDAFVACGNLLRWTASEVQAIRIQRQ